MAIKITVFSGERIISGECSKVQTLKPDGKPDYGSQGNNAGHEWEARCGLELDLDPAVLADPAILHSTVTGYQKAVTRLVREELTRMGAPLNGSALPAPQPTSQLPAPTTPPVKPVAAPASTGRPAPMKSVPQVPAPTTSGDEYKEAEDRERQAPAPAPPARKGKPRDGDAPRSGGELLGCANKLNSELGIEDDPKDWFTAFAKAQKPKWTTMIKDWDAQQVATGWKAYKDACRGD